MTRPGRGLLTASAVGLVLAGAAISTASAEAAAFLRGFADPRFDAADDTTRNDVFDASVRAGSQVVRINISWRNLTTGEPTLPTNPADPAYDFGPIDEAIREATSRGQEVIVTVYEAPDFAEGPGRPGDAPNGTWKPDPAALGKFAQAVATRYSGSFAPGVIPSVRYFEAWNEPNLSEYISPQFKGKKSVAADRFREMLNAFYHGVAASTNSSAQVILGGTSPYGDPIGQRRTRPLRFLREVFCLNGRLEAKSCPDEAKFDILAHHPITLSGGPNRSAIHPDDAAMPDFHNVVDTLRAAERKKTIQGGRHPAWATEVWWETDPPDRFAGVPVKKHARWVSEALYTLWRQGAGVVIWLQIVDTPIQSDGIGGYQTGLITADGKDKPSFQAFRFPFVANRTAKKKVTVWTIAPASGSLEIQEERGGEFRTIDRLKVTVGQPAQAKLKLAGKATLRGVLAGENSRPALAPK